MTALSLLPIGVGPGAELSVALERDDTYTRTMSTNAAATFLGTGYGNYDHVAGMHRDDEFKPPTSRTRNTYLKNALEIGIPVTAAMVLSIGWTR